MMPTTTEDRTTVTATSSSHGALGPGPGRGLLFGVPAALAALALSACAQSGPGTSRRRLPPAPPRSRGSVPDRPRQDGSRWSFRTPQPCWPSHLMPLPCRATPAACPRPSPPPTGTSRSISTPRRSRATSRWLIGPNSGWPISRARTPHPRTAAVPRRNGVPGRPRFLRGSTYVTRIGAHKYREIACLVAGTRGSSVLVVATPAIPGTASAPCCSKRWTRMPPR